jgi:hypothetical protein
LCASTVETGWRGTVVLGGVAVEDYSGRRTAGALLTVVAVGAAGSDLAPVSIRARVVRADALMARLSIAFLGLDAPAYAVLSGLIENTAATTDWLWPD